MKEKKGIKRKKKVVVEAKSKPKKKRRSECFMPSCRFITHTRRGEGRI